ncbi:hypothetical protein AB0D11_02745 [Streptomyces monashensis]|uniref:hypothetical protein n=1 Tax=Streptomyces monashensis TaxID=1678012 RepID=UPI0033D66CD7
MSPDSQAVGPMRSAAAVNEDIRALMLRAGGRLREEDRPVYRRLVEEWAAAIHSEVVEAA